MPLINLHAHSSRSDGTLPPAEVARAAAAAGITHFALTDHDSVEGCREASAELGRLGIRHCHAVEIGVYPHEYMHILGYCIDPACAELRNFLALLRELKVQRVKQCLALLKRHGIRIDYSEVPRRGGCPPDTWQVAGILARRGLAPSPTQAKKRWLEPGAPAHVPRRGPGFEEAIRNIKKAGGRAVLAHPCTIGKKADLGQLKDAGLEGLEVYYPRHTAEDIRGYLQLAARYGLFISAGTDFHGPGTERDRMTGYEYEPSRYGWLGV